MIVLYNKSNETEEKCVDLSENLKEKWRKTYLEKLSEKGLELEAVIFSCECLCAPRCTLIVLLCASDQK